MGVFLLAGERHWECPACEHTHVTVEHEPHSVMHPCAGLAGMTTPMVPAGTKCKVEAFEREDFIAGEEVQYNAEGRPIMSVVTTRETGEDCTVYAPCATAKREEYP